jgi:hypothetical protein
MSAPVPYFDLVRQMKSAFNYRLRLVTYARQYGIKAAARRRDGRHIPNEPGRGKKDVGGGLSFFS